MVSILREIIHFVLDKYGNAVLSKHHVKHRHL